MLMRAALLLLVFVAAFTIYVSNGQVMSSYDSAPNSLLAFNVLERHALDFDPLRHSYFAGLGGQYAFTEAPNGHLTSVFPIGTAILTFPVYAAFYVTEVRRGGPSAIAVRAFEPQRQHYEKEAAAAIAALCVVLFVLCAQILGTPFQAGVSTLVFALATSMWTISSQALWQHGPVNLTVLATLSLLLIANRTNSQRRLPWLLLLAGITAGFLPVIRPTAVLFSAAAAMYVIWAFRKQAWWFVPGLLLGMCPGVAWNLYFFHTLSGGYAGDINGFSADLAAAAIALAGLLLSPSRGLFVFTPVLLFSLLGAWRALQVRSRDARLLLLFAAASAALVVVYSFYREWWGGLTYGPRFLADVLAIGCLLLIYVLPMKPLAVFQRSARGRIAATLFVLTFLWSALVQFFGATSGASGSEWNSVPVSVDREPSRLWHIRDNQIVRNMRAAYYKDIAWGVTLSPEYRNGLAVRVISQTVLPKKAVPRATALDWRILLKNDGREPAYGYDSGVYVGQVRIRVRMFTPKQALYSEQYLYVMGSPWRGAEASADGSIVVPAAPGDYRVVLEPIGVGLGVVGKSPPLAMHLKVS